MKSPFDYSGPSETLPKLLTGQNRAKRSREALEKKGDELQKRLNAPAPAKKGRAPGHYR